MHVAKLNSKTLETDKQPTVDYSTADPKDFPPLPSLSQTKQDWLQDSVESIHFGRKAHKKTTSFGS